MEDPAEQLIRRALGRRPPPKPGPALVDDVMRRVTVPPQSAVPGRGGPWWLAIPWLTAAGASMVVLAHLEWSGTARTVAWGLALAVVPLAYSVTLWPARVLDLLLALCGGPLLGVPREEPGAVSRDRTTSSARPPG